MDKSTANLKARELLTQYGLGDWMDKKCEAMSKGMGQKVQILGTIIHNPDLVILDEPFSGLDPVNRDMMRDTILDMKREGRTVIFSTHVMEQAEQLCDAMMMLHKAELAFEGTVAEIKQGLDKGIRIDYDGDGSVLQQLPNQERINDNNKSAEIFLKPGSDPQDALRWLVDHLTIRSFDISEPSLHEVFVRTVEARDAELTAAGLAATGGNS
jgi:ABC-2 type transport system ATP-binding protein